MSFKKLKPSSFGIQPSVYRSANYFFGSEGTCLNGYHSNLQFVIILVLYCVMFYVLLLKTVVQ